MKLILASNFDTGFGKIAEILKANNLLSNKAIYIPTAAEAEGYTPDYELNEKLLEDIGIEVFNFDIKDKNPSQLRQAFNSAGIIYVGGGNSFYLLELINNSGFREVLREKLEEGVVYIGSSAGSIVCSPDINYIKEMDDPTKGKLLTTRGLGLIDFAFLPHMNSPYLAQQAQKINKEYSGSVPLQALYDEQIIYINNRSFEII